MQTWGTFTSAEVSRSLEFEANLFNGVCSGPTRPTQSDCLSLPQNVTERKSIQYFLSSPSQSYFYFQCNGLIFCFLKLYYTSVASSVSFNLDLPFVMYRILLCHIFSIWLLPILSILVKVKMLFKDLSKCQLVALFVSWGLY